MLGPPNRECSPGHPSRCGGTFEPWVSTLRTRGSQMKRFLTCWAASPPLLPSAAGLCRVVLFLALTAANFHAGLLALNRESSQTSVVEAFFNTVLFWFPFILIFPLLTMRLFSEEYKLGTIETLMTAPVRDGQVVLPSFWAVYFST